MAVITRKENALEYLCAEGILVSHPGKGVFVAEINPDYAKQKRMEQLKEQLSDVWEFAKGAGITAEEVVQMLNKLIKE